MKYDQFLVILHELYDDDIKSLPDDDDIKTLPVITEAFGTTSKSFTNT
jgi:hypothetical protein